MKKAVIVCTLLLFFTKLATAQIGRRITSSDHSLLKRNMIESLSNGSYYRLNTSDSLSPQIYTLSLIDSAGKELHQIVVNIPENNPAVIAFTVDTITQRLCITERAESANAYYMYLKVFDYNLNYIDSLTWGLTKSSSLGVDVFAGGIDTSGNKFIVYSSKDIFDQMWNRSICRKNSAGTIKNNIVKIGQAANDGFYINDVVITPTGNIYIAGMRKESLYGNFFYLERVNADFNTIFEVRDQLIENSINENHVSSIQIYNATANSQIVVGGTLYGQAPGDNMNHNHGVVRVYSATGSLRWNFQNSDVKDYTKVLGKNNFVHAIGSGNSKAHEQETKISRLSLKDGSVDWQRTFENNSVPSCLQIESDKSILVGGEKETTIKLQGGAEIKARSYMLIRYSTLGKRLYDYDHHWDVPNETKSVQAGITDLATCYNQFYYVAGTINISFQDRQTVLYSDSTYVQQFTNGPTRIYIDLPVEVTLNIRPNPAQGLILFTCESQVSDLVIFSMSGQKMSSENINQEGINYSCDISHLKTGTYVLRVKTNNIWYTSKFIKE